jgi:deoxyhypusine synthase
MVDAIVTTCGGIEEDFIKCMGSFYVGNFCMNDQEMIKNKLNRIGNIFLESKNYEKFEDWINIIF